MITHRTLWITIAVLAVVGLLVVGLRMSRGSQTENNPPDDGGARPKTGQSERREGGAAAAPSGLALPFDITQIRAVDYDVHPFGIVRFSQDRPEYGHSGIDIPLGRDAVIFAVADGKILDAHPADDDRPGQYVTLQLGTAPKPNGEGWVFLYEHILLDPELAVGSPVQRGQRIGQTAIPTSYNNHLQLSYAFNDFAYFRDHTCWIDNLAPDDAATLTGWFDRVKTTPALQNQWQTYAREGQYELRGLLDASRFPDGPELCYPPGTDVRMPVEGSPSLKESSQPSGH